MKKKKIIFFLLIFSIVILLKVNFTQGIYQMLNSTYLERISNVYGFCDREGIGYVRFLQKKFNLDKKIDLINSLKQNNNNSGQWAIYNTNFDENQKPYYLIVINYKKITNKVDLNGFKILHNFEDCYLLSKK